MHQHASRCSVKGFLPRLELYVDNLPLHLALIYFFKSSVQPSLSSEGHFSSSAEMDTMPRGFMPAVSVVRFVAIVFQLTVIAIGFVDYYGAIYRSTPTDVPISLFLIEGDVIFHLFPTRHPVS
jgi:hypothetical protein